MLSQYRFPAGVIEWKPIAVRKDQTSALAGAFVDIRNIQAALDDLSPGWHSDLTLHPAGKDFACVCSLTLNGIMRADTGSGETPMDASNQAFRRAACAHGLGRYLWIDSPRIWAAYDAQAKAFSAAGLATLRKSVDAGAEEERPDPKRWLDTELANTFAPDDRTLAQAFVIKRYSEKETPAQIRTMAADLADDELLKIVYSLRDHRFAWRTAWQKHLATA